MPDEKLSRILEQANSIKRRIRKCETAAEVATVADEERANVQAMAETDEGRPLAIQIANLKAYRLWELSKPL